MPIITMTHTIRTYFEVPEGLTIEQVSAEVLDFDPIADAEDALREVHRRSLGVAYAGHPVHEVGQSTELNIIEGYPQR